MKNIKNIMISCLCAALALALLGGCAASDISFSGVSPIQSGLSAPAQDGQASAQNGSSAPSQGSSAVPNTAKVSSTELDGISCLSVTSGGAYTLSGDYEDQMILVDAKGEEVELILNGANISCSKSPAIYVRAAGSVTLTLAGGSSNSLSDGKSYSIEDNDSSLDGCIFSKADLVLAGSGSVSVSGNYKHGIVSKDSLKVEGGNWQISSVKTGIQGKDRLDMNGGSVAIAAGTNGMASEGALSVNGGSLNIAQCKEGLEALTVDIAGGDTYISASDDGINASDPETSSGQGMGFGMMGMGGNSACEINISGGRLAIASKGDGIDSNGNVNISGGEIYIDGPVNNGDQAVDWQTKGSVSGGTMIATGSAGMASNVSSSENQATVFIGLSGEAGKEICLKDASGNVLAAFTPSKSYQCALITSPVLSQGKSYTVTVDGAEAASFTVDSLTMDVNSSGMGGFGGFGKPGSGGFGKFKDQEGQVPSDGNMPQMPSEGQAPENGARPERPDGGSRPRGSEDGTVLQLPSEGSQLPNMNGKNSTVY